MNMQNEKKPIIICENLVKIYKVVDLEVVALQGLDLIVDRGEMLGIVGTSGSGKSTLMQLRSRPSSLTFGRKMDASKFATSEKPTKKRSCLFETFFFGISFSRHRTPSAGNNSFGVVCPRSKTWTWSRLITKAMSLDTKADLFLDIILSGLRWKRL